MCPCMFRMLLHCLTGWFRSRCRLGDKSKSEVVWGFVVAFAFLCALMSQPPVFVITYDLLSSTKNNPKHDVPRSPELEYAGEQLERISALCLICLHLLSANLQDTKPWSLQADARLPITTEQYSQQPQFTQCSNTGRSSHQLNQKFFVH